MSSHKMTHAALARSVDELVQWLGVVEPGLNGVLARTAPGAANVNGAIEGDLTGAFGESNGRLERVREDEEGHSEAEDTADRTRIVAEPEELEALDEQDEEGRIDADPGSFEQFLANVHRQKQRRADSPAGANGIGGYALEDAVYNHNQNGYRPGHVHAREQRAAVVS